VNSSTPHISLRKPIGMRNSPEVNSDPSAGEAPVDAAPVQETPMSGTDDVVVPMDEKTVAESTAHETPVGTNAGSSAALLSREESEHYRMRWNEIQGKFVDEPRSAVQQADALVSEVIEQIT
jgi:hypothetical protein